tara:strand:+ start:334 stop:972 length:639 start_codon:yes stop_codon:yes gene_type:complete
MEIKFETIKIFGPSVIKAKIPNDILIKINKYVDDVIEDKQKSKDLNYGEKLVGDVTQEIRLDEKFATESGWLNFLALTCSKWIEQETQKKISKFNVISSWVVRQFKDEYNPIHWHGGHVSGAGFLKLPNTFGESKQKKNEKKYVGGHLDLIHGSKMFLSKSIYEITPQVGDFYFFPNYLMHTVYPFNGSDEERRSISFNATIDEKIYNVYGN